MTRTGDGQAGDSPDRVRGDTAVQGEDRADDEIGSTESDGTRPSEVARGEGLVDPSDTRANCGVGALVDLDGGASHEIVADALDLLGNMEHRGARGAEPNTGDGAGIMIERPDEFFDAVLDVDLPETYAVGTLFLPEDDQIRTECERVVTAELTERDVRVLAWRDVPTDADEADLGDTARASEPVVSQVFVAPDGDTSPDAFDHSLYVARRAIESELDGIGTEEVPYVVSLDRQRVVYKGLLTAEQLSAYYPDLRDDRLESGVALVHARFSTNTLGAWHLAHPYRNIVHNGEFNTIDGNVSWMQARESDLAGGGFSTDELDTVTPVVTDPDQSDTASVDETLDLLLQGGRDLPHALRMLIPEAYRNDEEMSPERKAFYDYHSSLVEPWDGPALVIGFDGERVAGVLDRNGLRPCRYDVTTDNRLVMASEAGALDVPPEEIVDRGRLRPGEVFVADPAQGRVVPDDEVFEDLTDETYAEWVDSESFELGDLVGGSPDPAASFGDDLRSRQVAAGYTQDQLNVMLEPMMQDGKDPVGSMGDDTPLSVLADANRSLFTYFKQGFAQVSNPPIDYIREDLVTSLETRLGPQRNLLGETAEHARQLVCDSPILTDTAAEAIHSLDDSTDGKLTARTLDTTFAVGDDDSTDLQSAVADLRRRASEAVEAGADILVLSDRAVDDERIAIPSLLATGAVHTHLVREGLRAKVGLVVETADAAEVHHCACLVGYGAGAIVPYLSYETVRDLVAGPDGAEAADALSAYRHALEDGLQKTMAKMGISTMESYQGAAIFEAVGLDADVVSEYFTDTECRTEGIGLDEIETDVRERHASAYDRDPDLPRTGEYQHRNGGERHGWNPDSVSSLHSAVRSGDESEWDDYAEAVNGGETPDSLRDTLAFDSDRESIPLEEVEPVESIVERFSTAAMSLGSLSPEAHETNAEAMNRIGGKSNTGEGGEPPERFGTETECSVKQVASGRFGVTSAYLANAEEIQIKMAQGSKPGEGGHLPGSKVNDLIAHVRCSTPGVGLISPPPQHDIYSIEDLKQLIHDLKSANPDADVNVKLVAGSGIGTIAAGVAKANADAVHISGHSGGTGASARSSIKNAGLPWELGLSEANQMLRETDLRDKIRVSVDGGLKTGRDVAVGALLGAEEFAFGTASLVSAGCVMARQCHQNTCPVGVATQREDLRDRFPGEPEHVVNFMTFVATELREIMADLGFESVEEMVGRPDCLTQREDLPGRASELELDSILAEPAGDDRTKTEAQPSPVGDQIDDDLLDVAGEQIDHGEDVRIDHPVTNADRAVGTTVSHRVSEVHGDEGLPDDTVRLRFRGSAGQSFGAFLAPGVTASVVGAANDYVGKGLSGGTVTVRTPEDAGYDPAENVVVGNVALYGATDGEMYVEGVAGERFAVRNSGVKAVVEGVGDHGCEYMTGGVVAVLGDVGRNFAAGMSGGVAYVYDPDGTAEERVNRSMVSTSRSLTGSDRAMLRRLVENHAARTDSDRAADLLASWEAAVDDFVRVLPDAYADVLAQEESDDVRTDLPDPASATSQTGAGGAVSDD